MEKAAATEEAYAGPTAAVLQVVAPLTACGGRFVAKLEDFDVEESDVDGALGASPKRVPSRRSIAPAPAQGAPGKVGSR